MAFQKVRATKEITAGTYQAAAPGTDVAQIRLVGDNGFPGRKEPVIWTLRDVAGSNRPVQTGSTQYSCKGSFSTPFYFSQAKVLLPWACTLAGSPLDLPSITLDHAYQMADSGGTLAFQRFLGSKCRTFGLRASNTAQGAVAMLSFDFEALDISEAITATDYPAVALTAYPSDQPVTFQLSAGGLTLGAAARTLYSEISLTATNMLDSLYDEAAHPTRIWWGGRDVTLTAKFRLVSQTDRTAFKALTAQSCILTFTDGVTVTTFDLKGAVRTTGVADEMPMGGPPYQTLTCTGYLDTTAGTDLTVATTP